MKRTLLTLVAVVMAFSASVYAGTRIAENQLPQTARDFIAKHFPGDAIRKAESDQGRRGTEYEVDLNSGAEIDFSSDGNWKEVKAAHGQAVPDAIVPEGIAKLVKDSYSGLAIKEISRKRGGYEVELTNGTELKLTEDGKPMPARQHGGQGRGQGQGRPGK